jgi:hypothetical protein
MSDGFSLAQPLWSLKNKRNKQNATGLSRGPLRWLIIPERLRLADATGLSRGDSR